MLRDICFMPTSVKEFVRCFGGCGSRGSGIYFTFPDSEYDPGTGK